MFRVNDSAGFLLGTLAKKTAARFTQLMQAQNIDIGHSGWIVLSRLWEEDGLSQQEISDRSGVAKPNISTYIDALEQTDYVVRVDDAADRRNYKIFITQKAKKLKDKCQALAQQSNEETLQPLTPAEREALLKLLKKMRG
ncbi:MAG TPA: MarR family transcriptional regulator [Chitinophagaceae bacterium]|jgi:DNA-binding MarR family transcriptional regulator|nr:MarR family transcriptional regulator [Chitinophagaceae bacterium]